MTAVEADRFLMMRIASSRSGNRLESEEAVTRASSASSCSSYDSFLGDREDEGGAARNKTPVPKKNGGVRRMITRKLLQWRGVGSGVTVLRINPKMSSKSPTDTATDDGASTTALEEQGKRGSFVKLGSMLRIPRNQHDRLKAMTSAHAKTQKHIKKQSIKWDLQIMNVEVWASSSNPLFEGTVPDMDLDLLREECLLSSDHSDSE